MSISREELNDDIHEQAETALSYLNHALQIECSEFVEDKGDAPASNTGRTLDKYEKEVKDSALTCLLSYFVKDLDFKNTIPDRKRTNKKPRPIHDKTDKPLARKPSNVI